MRGRALVNRAALRVSALRASIAFAEAANCTITAMRMRGGVADANHIQRSGDTTAKAGQTTRKKPEDVRRLFEIIDRTAANLDVGVRELAGGRNGDQDLRLSAE